MASKKKSQPFYEEAAEKILERKGQSYKEWKLKKISERQMAVLQGIDKEWESKVVEEECYKLMAKNIQQ